MNDDKEMDDLLADDTLDEMVNFTDETLREVPPDLKPEVEAKLKAMGKLTKKNERKVAFTKFAMDFSGKIGDIGIKAIKKAVLPLAMLCLLLASGAKAGSFLSPIWNDVKANSHLNLGKDIAYGAGHDFINGENYHGGIFSIYNYRKLHLEYGLLDPFKDGPVSHSIGGGIRIQPFIMWARIPDDYSAIKKMYLNTSARYDLHHWGFMLLVHAGFGK